MESFERIKGVAAVNEQLRVNTINLSKGMISLRSNDEIDFVPIITTD